MYTLYIIHYYTTHTTKAEAENAAEPRNDAQLSASAEALAVAVAVAVAISRRRKERPKYNQ